MKQNDKEKELKFLRDRWYLFYEFTKEKYGNDELFSKSKALINEAFNAKNIKILKAANDDINSMFRQMPSTDALDLMNLFRNKLGEDISKIYEKYLLSIARIVKRGKLKSPKDYELILNRVEEIYNDSTRTTEINQLNNLLANYHSKS